MNLRPRSWRAIFRPAPPLPSIVRRHARSWNTVLQVSKLLGHNVLIPPDEAVSKLLNYVVLEQVIGASPPQSRPRRQWFRAHFQPRHRVFVYDAPTVGKLSLYVHQVRRGQVFEAKRHPRAFAPAPAPAPTYTGGKLSPYVHQVRRGQVFKVRRRDRRSITIIIDEDNVLVIWID